MMTKESILLQIQHLLSEILKKDDIEINESTTSKDIDGWDSLNHMIIIARIEKHFGVIFNFREVMKLKNIGDLRDAILIKME